LWFSHWHESQGELSGKQSVFLPIIGQTAFELKHVRTGKPTLCSSYRIHSLDPIPDSRIGKEEATRS
jgi:hypothetical protein